MLKKEVLLMNSYIKEHSRGILGTIIFHLIMLITFLFIKISTLDESGEGRFIIEIEEEVIPREKLEIEKEKLEKLLPDISEEVRRNIAVNTAQQIEEKISTEKYIQQLKEELNIKDPPENWKEMLEAEYLQPNDKDKKEQDEEKVYTGQTNIEYFLENRTDRYIHVPVYKCQGSATVVIEITVNQQGYVSNVSVDNQNTTTGDPCFIEEASHAAMRSRFNPDINAPVRQKGTITYKFVAQ